jgi:hypothetical protein
VHSRLSRMTGLPRGRTPQIDAWDAWNPRPYAEIVRLGRDRIPYLAAGEAARRRRAHRPSARRLAGAAGRRGALAAAGFRVELEVPG